MQEIDNNTKYRSYFNIQDEFIKATSENDFELSDKKWLKYLPHTKFIEMLRIFADLISGNNRTRGGSSVWIEGAYGTGKTYSVLTLKKILEAPIEEVRTYFNNFELPSDLLGILENIKKNKIITIYKRGSTDLKSTDHLVIELQEKLLDVIKSKGYKGAEESIRNVGIKYLEHPDHANLFQAIINKTTNWTEAKTVEGVINDLRNSKSETALVSLIQACDNLMREHKVHAFELNHEQFATWIKALITENNISAIVVLWDEFDDFFNNNSSITNFQEHIIDLAKYKFLFVPITHKSDALFDDADPSKKIFDRFVKPRSLMELPDSIAFDLIAKSLKLNTALKLDWENKLKNLKDLISDSQNAVMQEIKDLKPETLNKILPLHPYTALILKHLCEKLGSNQRSMFSFILEKGSENKKTFKTFIDENGPLSDIKFIFVDYLWDFFDVTSRTEEKKPEIRNIFNTYTRVHADELTDKEKTVFKTILILIATSSTVNNTKPILLPNEANLKFCFEGHNITPIQASNLANSLIQKHFIGKKEIVNGTIYSVSLDVVDDTTLAPYIEKVNNETKTLTLVKEAELEQIMHSSTAMPASLKNRIEFKCVTVDNINKEINTTYSDKKDFNKYKNKIIVFLCFSRDNKKHQSMLTSIDDNYNKYPDDQFIFIDMGRKAMSTTIWNTYAKHKAKINYCKTTSREPDEDAIAIVKDMLCEWKKVIESGEFGIWNRAISYVNTTVSNLRSIREYFLEVNKKVYPYGLETYFSNLSDTVYDKKNIKAAAKHGSNRSTWHQLDFKLKNAFDFAWDDERYWESKPNEKISKLKIFFDTKIDNKLTECGECNFTNLYNELQSKPYGFTDSDLTAYVLGFLLKEYIKKEGDYYYSDGTIDANLTDDKVSTLVSVAIEDSKKPNFIKCKSPEEKKFIECTQKIFNIQKDFCSSTKIRDQLRRKFEEFHFPIWTLKYLDADNLVNEILELYSGLANTDNYDNGKKSEIEIAKDIGKIFLDNEPIVDRLCPLIDSENCKKGMKIHLSNYKDGSLPNLCEELKIDENAYLIYLKSKFSGAGNWVWSYTATNEQIDRVITDYELIKLSREIGIHIDDPSKIVSEYKENLKCCRVAYEAVKSIIKCDDLFSRLIKIYRDEQGFSNTAEFLELLNNNKENFKHFMTNQEKYFKEYAKMWISDLSEAQISDIYTKIGTGHFADEANDYYIVLQNNISAYKKSMSSGALRQYWKELTYTKTPKEWSKKYCAPILALVPKQELQEARQHFATINNDKSENEDAKKALEYLKNANWLHNLKPGDAENAFKNHIIGKYSTLLLDSRNVQEHLLNNVNDDPYDWFSNDTVKSNVKDLAKDEYEASSLYTALEIIEKISEGEIKNYLIQLIQNNMDVGLEIIANEGANNV
ncbi:MAG: hypothetical protein LBE09_07885 [Christensenellaceae bacterium]|jgi:hypothetical protein|nr:hypothetical protein [Christensenellaceae bacterium]